MNGKMDFMQRYYTDEGFRRRVIKAVVKYNGTERGKAVRKKVQERMQKKGYYSVYMKKKRLWARANEMCQSCFKNKAEEGKTSCVRCAKQASERAAKRREDGKAQSRT